MTAAVAVQTEMSRDRAGGTQCVAQRWPAGSARHCIPLSTWQQSHCRWGGQAANSWLLRCIESSNRVIHGGQSRYCLLLLSIECTAALLWMVKGSVAWASVWCCWCKSITDVLLVLWHFALVKEMHLYPVCKLSLVNNPSPTGERKWEWNST